MSKTSKTNSTTTTNQVQTPTNPAWVDSGLQGIAGHISNLSNLDPYSLIAGPSALETQAATTAGGLAPSTDFGKASGIYGGIGPNAVQGASLLDGLQNYMSPYTNDVVNTSLADYDHGAGYTRAQNQLSLAGDDTFGGSGGAIQTAISNDNIDRGRGALSAQLRDQAFNTGAGLSSQDAQRRQQAQEASVQASLAAAQGLTGNAAQQGQDARADVTTQGALGQILQQLAQAKAGAPVSLLGTQAGLYSGLPLGLEHGQTMNGTQNTNGTTTVSDPMGSIGSGLMGAAALFGAPFTGGASLGLLGSLGGAMGLGGAGALASGAGALVSDRRLKRDIEKVGELANGLGVYLYRYLWSPIQFLGVMAQEVLKVRPEAVITLPSGHLAVDYGAL